MVTVYGIANQKGGVGKTATSISLAAALAENDNASVLLIDLDPQGHASEGVGCKEMYIQESYNLFDALMPVSKQPGKRQSKSTENEIDVSALVKSTPKDKFFLIPSHYQMALAEQALNPVTGREYRLDILINAFQDAFTHIVIDCPPNLGILTDNAIYAARRGQGGLIIPVQAERSSMRALELLLDQIESTENGLRIEVLKLAVVPNLVQKPLTNIARQILNELRTNINVTLEFDIPRRILVQEAYDEGISIFTYAPKEQEKKIAAEELRKLYRQLVSIAADRIKNDGK